MPPAVGQSLADSAVDLAELLPQSRHLSCGLIRRYGSHIQLLGDLVQVRSLPG